MPDTTVLREAAERAIRLYEGLDHARVSATATHEELLGRFAVPLPGSGMDPVEVLDRLLEDAAGGLVGSGGPRFFGWVIGGSLPTAIATD